MIKTAIVGFGNLGRGALKAVFSPGDMECAGIFTRRAPEKIEAPEGVKVYHISEIKNFKGKLDVLLI